MIATSAAGAYGGAPAVGVKKLVFAYDYRGRRARRQVFEWTGSGYTLIAERRFIYDGWNLLMELDGLAPGGTGVPPVIRTYTWGLDLSGQSGNATVSGLHGAGGIGGLLATHDTNGTPADPSDDADYLYFHDANGNVGQLLDTETGAVVCALLVTLSYCDMDSNLNVSPAAKRTIPSIITGLWMMSWGCRCAACIGVVVFGTALHWGKRRRAAFSVASCGVLFAGHVLADGLMGVLALQ